MGATPIFLIIALLFYNKMSIVWGLVVTSACVGVIKLTTNLFPEDHAIYRLSRRPKSATCCDILSLNSDDQSNAAGFPSGHMAFITYFIMRMPDESFIFQNYINILLWAITAYDRTATNCHTTLQVLSGSLLGLLLSKSI